MKNRKLLSIPSSVIDATTKKSKSSVFRVTRIDLGCRHLGIAVQLTDVGFLTRGGLGSPSPEGEGDGDVATARDVKGAQGAAEWRLSRFTCTAGTLSRSSRLEGRP
jgi:hypothetical protein